MTDDYVLMQTEIRRLRKVCNYKDTAINYALTLIQSLRNGTAGTDETIDSFIEDIKSYIG